MSQAPSVRSRAPSVDSLNLHKTDIKSLSSRDAARRAEVVIAGCILDKLNQMPHALDKSLANHWMNPDCPVRCSNRPSAPAQPLGCKPKMGANEQPDLIALANLLSFEACAQLRREKAYTGGGRRFSFRASDGDRPVHRLKA